MSNEALKAKGAQLRAMRIHRRTTMTLDDLADWLNPIVRGWINYYGRFHRTGMIPLLQRVSTYRRRGLGRSTDGCGPMQLSDGGGPADRSTAWSVRPMEVGPSLLTD